MFRHITLLLSATFLASAAPNDGFLTTHGNDIKNAKGETVLLRGVNLGGWLLFEPWMTPMDSSGTKDHHSATEVLIKRFGKETAARLLDTYQDNWITTADLDNIASHGMNVVRIPFWYRTLQTEDGDWLPDGFKRLDWVVSEAWKRGIHSILDFHGAPGGQTKGATTGRIRDTAEFWRNEDHLTRTIDIWKKIAARYKGNPAVAAYDLLNEPSDAPSPGALWSAYDRIYQGIRSVDPDHIITVEGCINARVGDRDIHWGWDALPHPDLFGWSNVLYQLHHYEWDWNNLEKQNRGVDFQIAAWNRNKSLGVPAYMGEFNPMAREEAWKHAIQQYSDAGMHWTFWNYKATHGTGADSWGLYNPVRKDAPNLLTDDESVIRAKWAATRTGQSFALNPMLDRVLKSTRWNRSVTPAASAPEPPPREDSR